MQNNDAREWRSKIIAVYSKGIPSTWLQDQAYQVWAFLELYEVWGGVKVTPDYLKCHR